MAMPADSPTPLVPPELGATITFDVRHILVPIDFSELSGMALATAADLARRFSAHMTLLHVYPVPGYVLPDGFVPAGPEVLAQVEARTQESLKAWQTEGQRLSGASVEIASSVGHAATEITQCALDRGVDLIVIGSHGRTGFAHLLLGSVAEKVLRSAPCPVLTMRAPKDVKA